MSCSGATNAKCTQLGAPNLRPYGPLSIRFGFVVTGYSGRDQSVMELFRSVLKTPDPFPHGLRFIL
jgi:hypothetical protein